MPQIKVCSANSHTGVKPLELLWQACKCRSKAMKRSSVAAQNVGTSLGGKLGSSTQLNLSLDRGQTRAPQGSAKTSLSRRILAVPNWIWGLTTGSTGRRSNSGGWMVIPGPRSNSALSGASSTIFFSSLRKKRFMRVRPAVSVVAPIDQIREKTNSPSIILMDSLGSTCRWEPSCRKP